MKGTAVNYVKISSLLIVILFFLSIVSPSNGQNILLDSKWTWADSIDQGNTYEWEVNTFEIREESVDSINQTDLFPYKEGSTVTIEILSDPTTVNLTDGPDKPLRDVFDVSVDDTEPDNYFTFTYTFLYPIIVTNSEGTTENIFDLVYRYPDQVNAPHIFNGESPELEDQLFIGEAQQYSKEDNEFVFKVNNNDFGDDFSWEIRWIFDTGVMTEYSLTDGDVDLVITTKNDGFFDRLSLNIWLISIPLFLIPLFNRYIKSIQ